VSSLAAHLKDLVETISAELPEVTGKRMFGADAFFANRNIYAMIWDGRVVLRLTDPALATRALALEGADPFDPTGQGRFGRWVIMSEALHDDVEALTFWVESAHRLAMALPPKKLKGPKQAKAPRQLEAPKRRAPVKAARAKPVAKKKTRR
jgi:TfoX/Sxy family transcriptional regulator of competence genes